VVNRKNVSYRQDLTPPNEGAKDRKIAGGPLYAPAQVLQVILGDPESTLRLWTRDSNRDFMKLDWELSDLASAIRLAVTSGTYIDSEWCVQSPTGPVAACDAYEITRREWIAAARKELPCTYFLKFAISRTGSVLLVVSCHV
jgi:hypothetical protein